MRIWGGGDLIYNNNFYFYYYYFRKLQQYENINLENNNFDQ